MNKKLINGVYTIIDPEEGSNIFELTKKVIFGGVKIVQYRDKINTISQKIINAKKIKHICEKYNTLFIVNDSADLAKEVDSDGVHIGQNDDTVEYCKKPSPRGSPGRPQGPLGGPKAMVMGGVTAISRGGSLYYCRRRNYHRI